jgi:alpha-glucosidase
MSLLPNIQDQQAIDAQTVCPGYTASDVKENDFGLAASLTLAGKACNVYGTDVDTLTLTVEYQSAQRLSINISPTNVVRWAFNRNCRSANADI